MRYSVLFAVPFSLILAANVSAQQLVPISIPAESRSVLYPPVVEYGEPDLSVTTLEPVEAEYASTAPSLSEPYYTSSPASTVSAPCGCSPCAPCGCAPACYSPCASCGTAPAYQPVVTLRPVPTPYRVGRGIIGQPKLYVDGQPIRNTLRFFTP